MKTDLELLEELLYDYRNCRDNKKLQFGLCWFVKKQVKYSYDGYIYLKNLINTNRPKIMHNKRYFFPKGDVPSRIEYLKELIKKYKK